MVNGLKTACAMGLLCVMALGCQNKVADERDALYRQNRELQDRTRQLEAERDARADPAALAQMQQQLAARDAQIADLQNQLRQPQPGAVADQSLSGIEVTRDERAGTMTVNLPGDVLFTSGKADLKDSAKATLTKVTNAIKKSYAGKRVIVQGYTDTDPINKTKDKWQDNLDLSAARARTVAGFLTEQGISAKEIGLQAYGDTIPKGSKDRSRRVEIVIATR